ncbi:hypothetical protein ACP275_14G151800 [Erythranthe tilingii]
MSHLSRYVQKNTPCRSDVVSFNPQFLRVFESLIPAVEIRVKQKQLFTSLENLITQELPRARLFMYGSCANTFSLFESDIDICLDLGDNNVDKSDVLLGLADLFRMQNFKDVQAITNARVPVLKLKDPTTGISCDICVNNMLAVVNTKLLRDYSQIDVRLRQLVLIVKYWAKSRKINEAYRGTLSSYSYVLMCIHFLQQRWPAILPCLQRMGTTYSTTAENIECSYFDRVEELRNFGIRNRENLSILVWAFFHYWAYCHDYVNDAISVRTGDILSKREKGWTIRVGNDRHLMCIEDPFDVYRDLGRFVDRSTLRIIRQEFERAAEIMQYDSQPFVSLFEPYVRCR